MHQSCLKLDSEHNQQLAQHQTIAELRKEQIDSQYAQKVLEQTKQQLSNMEHKLKETLAQNTKQYEEIFGLEECIKQKESKIEQLSQSILEQDAELAGVKRELQELACAHADVVEMKTQMQVTIRDLKYEIAEFDKKTQKLKDDF